MSQLMKPYPNVMKQVGLRKLLEAKDCFVRARAEAMDD